LCGELGGDLWCLWAGLRLLVCAEEGGFWGDLPGWEPGCRKPARCRPVLSGTHPWSDGWSGVVSITCRRGCCLRCERSVPSNVWLTMGETKFALYLGAVFSTLLRVFTYLFLRLVHLFLSPGCVFLTVNDRFPSDGLNTCCPVSIAPTSQPSLSHLVFPDNRRRILLRVHRHPLKRRIRRRRPLVVIVLL
jgi:hypothetical protein